MFQKTRIVAGTFLLGTALFTATVLTAAQLPAERGEKGDKGGGKGGPPGGRGGPRPPIGAIVPPHLVDELGFTDAQKKDLADLQKEVDTRLAKILTDDQKKQLAEMRDRGPGPRGGPDGERGGDKGGPPGGKGDKGGKGGPPGKGDKGSRPQPE